MPALLKPQFFPGDTYGSWTITQENRTLRQVHVKCACGFTSIVDGYDLLKQKTKGCKPCSLARQTASKKPKIKKEPVSRKTHGCATPGKQTPEYKVWDAINQRCNNPNSPAYINYGARGITLCPEWTGPGGFEKFIAHVGLRPDASKSLDRIDNDKGYTSGNVRWTDRKTQCRNKRNALLITVNGVEKPLAEYAELYDIKYYTVWGRIKRGVDPLLALTLGRNDLMKATRREKTT